jgi:glycosyltransferase involved in cell wall biosynthesis
MNVEVPVDSRAIVLTEVEQMGGAERSVLALSRWLHQRGLPHHFVTYVDRADLAAHAAYPLTVVQLLPELRVTSKVAALRRYFASRRGGPQPLVSGYQAALHATLAGLRGFHTLMHDTPSLFEDQAALDVRQRLNRWLSDKVTAHGLKGRAAGGRGHTMVTSEYLRAESRRVFGVEAEIVRLGGLEAAGAFRPRPVQRELRLLSVSRVESNKRIDWMLRALARMQAADLPLSSRVDWRLDVAGHGAQLGAMQALAAELGLEGRVHFLGYVSDAALQDLYAKAHLFLMPAVQGYGIPAIEAISSGLPVLLHRESGVSDILLHTPWASVIHGGEEGMLPGLQKAVDAVIAGQHLTAALPPLPTEEAWAGRVATLCGWV